MPCAIMPGRGCLICPEEWRPSVPVGFQLPSKTGRAPFAPSTVEFRARCKPAALLLGLAVSLGSAVGLQGGQQPGSDPTEAPVTAASKTAPSFTIEDRFRFYEETTFAPFAFAGPVTGAALTEWVTGNPEEWGQGFPGYGRRLLSGYGRQVIANTTGLGVLFADHEDPRHYPTGQHGMWKRGLYAARETFVAHRTSGGEMPAYSRILGIYTAGFVSNAWYPARESNTRSALYRGSTALASNMVWQLLKEFWPDAHRKLRRKPKHGG